jgi:hydrogenase maturation protease
MEESKVKLAVIGVGNLLLKDEGIGVHIAHALQQTDIPHGTKIIDGGTSSDLPYYLKDIDTLIIIDAVKGRSQPGTIYRFHLHDVNIESEGMLSVHELGLEQSLKMMSLMGSEPKETVIIGIEPKEIDWGTELSAELQQKIPEVINVVLNEISSRLKD